MTEQVKLTEYSHGGGCGCKIAPQVLEEMLHTSFVNPANTQLLVGNESKDDAAVYDAGNGTGIISTTDFFMPIVDDAFDFGRIASANAISDVFAMGGKPMMAIALLGWPVNKLPAALAQKVLDGARAICAEAGIPLAGGHSIDTQEPMFGLAVTGTVNLLDLKRNNTAREGDLLFLTKKLGVGILATAQKRKVLKDEFLEPLMANLTTLNKIGALLGKIEGVHAMTDVTGFGLAGHLTEMAEGSKLSSELYYNKLQVLDGVAGYITEGVGPGATSRNWSSYGSKVEIDESIDNKQALNLLPDPQTNGGLLIAVSPGSADEVIALFKEHGLGNFTEPIGKMIAAQDKLIYVKQ